MAKQITRADVTRAFNQNEAAPALFKQLIAEGNGGWIAEEATARRTQSPDWRPSVVIMQLRRMDRGENDPIVTLSWDKEGKQYRLSHAAKRAPRQDKDLEKELRRLCDAYGVKTVTDTLSKVVATLAKEAA